MILIMLDHQKPIDLTRATVLRIFLHYLPSPRFEAMPFGSSGICSELQAGFLKGQIELSQSQSKGHITDPRHVQRPSGMLKMPWTVSAHGS